MMLRTVNERPQKNVRGAGIMDKFMQDTLIVHARTCRVDLSKHQIYNRLSRRPPRSRKRFRIQEIYRYKNLQKAKYIRKFMRAYALLHTCTRAHPFPKYR